MYIIPQIEGAVNPSALRFAEHKKVAEPIIKRLKEIGENGRAGRMADCATELEYRFCPECGKYHIARSNLCRDRLCPTCQWRLSVQRYGEMVQVFGNIMHSHPNMAYYFLTLTVKNVPGEELRDTILDMSKGWNAITRRKYFKEGIIGWCRSIEVTYNKREKTFHPHIHIIMVARADMAKSAKEFRQLWRHAMKTDYDPIIDIREVKRTEKDEDITGAVLETFKYTIKSKSLGDMPLSDFSAFASSVKGIRLQSFGGIVKTARAALGMADTDEVSADEMTLDKCPDCGADMATAIMRWTEGTYQLEGIRT